MMMKTAEPSPALIFGSDDVYGIVQKIAEGGCSIRRVGSNWRRVFIQFVDADGNYFVVSGN